ncbi:dipeptide/oligopeptide/nickel ABC transporter permease/ATP-binding protein [Treponema pectinovorum]|uniref:dipeptide/oligopeptide/nickel ABC transporter permease/ATP-binding protein n=1 Tax=Treponema pectinovorum TaxID=164 RepID=UPI0011CC9D08|nr:dipeptide/oligopeptide/nickel ABC transporter permease/ATP-binding protein [Treponema pectinovorum]
MKKIFRYIKSRPLALISVIFIAILYLLMIFAPFIAPYTAVTSFEKATFHPANVEISSKGLVAREFRVLNPSVWQYAKVKGLKHKISFFVEGEKYKLFGFIPCKTHLFGTKADEQTGEIYPVFLFGADNLGRDTFSRLLYGSRISLTIGFVASAISLFLAILFGGLAGFFGSFTDWFIMRFSEFFMLIPSLYLILFLRSLLNTKLDSGQSYMIITLILSLVGWPGSARTLRGIVHSLKREDFVQNARLEKIPSLLIIFRYIIPQISSLLIVSTTLSIPGFIMSETTLSYLGLGIADPAVSWGSMINREISTLSNLKNFPWLLIPVVLLLLVTLAFNFFGDCLRDYFDPYNIIFKKKTRKIRNKDKGGENAPLAPAASASSATPLCEAQKNVSAASQRSALSLNKDNILSVRNLKVSFLSKNLNDKKLVYAVRNVSFDVRCGEILGVVGESGSGKSVSTTAITGLLPNNAEVTGSILFNDGLNFIDLQKLSSLQKRDFRGKKIGMIFQESGRAFDPLQNIFSCFYETFLNSDKKITKEQAQKKACALLEEVGITDAQNRLKNFPHQFSGGQLQRISIALSLAQDCSLLIADEPTTALDVTVQAQIVNLLRRLNKTRRLSIIFISHNIKLIAQFCDTVVVMYGGKIMEKGETQKLLSSPKHPYTKALIASIPEFGIHYTKQNLLSIPGKVYDSSKEQDGCPFFERCAFAKQECKASDLCYKMLESI